VANKTKKKHF